ncbi:hypothetical protein LINPERPRIM_LOCUS40728 [Linum perenne]
MRTLTSM